jgi:hypothetical protein
MTVYALILLTEYGDQLYGVFETRELAEKTAEGSQYRIQACILMEGE